MSGKASGRIRSGLVAVRLGGALPQDALEVRDVSLRGLQVQLTYPVAQGQELPVEVAHPILEAPVTLGARVEWCRVEAPDPRPLASLEFTSTTSDERRDLRRIQAAEVSSRVVVSGRTGGFILTQQEDTWAVYDGDTVKVALVKARDGGFEACRMGSTPQESIFALDVDSLQEAVAVILELEETPAFVPPDAGEWVPVRPRPAAAPHAGVGRAASAASAAALPDSPSESIHSRAFHRVLAAGYHVGYLAATSVDEAWSLFDEKWNEVAILSHERDLFKVIVMGVGPEDSLDYLMAKSFLGGIALAYNLKVEPELDPPLAEALGPTDSQLEAEAEAAEGEDEAAEGEDEDAAPPALIDDEDEDEDAEAPLRQDRPHHCIIDGEIIAGYAAPTHGLVGVYSVYNTAREKIAMIAPEAGRYRVLFMGSSPDESLEYMVARSFEGALALILELERLPEVDPPLPA